MIDSPKKLAKKVVLHFIEEIATKQLDSGIVEVNDIPEMEEYINSLVILDLGTVKDMISDENYEEKYKVNFTDRAERGKNEDLNEIGILMATGRDTFLEVVSEEVSEILAEVEYQQPDYLERGDVEDDLPNSFSADVDKIIKLVNVSRVRYVIRGVVENWAEE